MCESDVAIIMIHHPCYPKAQQASNTVFTGAKSITSKSRNEAIGISVVSANAMVEHVQYDHAGISSLSTLHTTEPLMHG